MKLFIFDFDGTITKEDSTDIILRLPEKDQIWRIEEDWKEGKITSYQCMKAQARFLKEITIKEIRQCLKEQSHIDVNFPSLVSFLKAMDFHTIILSEGYDVSIKFHQIHKYVKNIHCSKLLVENGKVTGELEVSNQKKWDYNVKCIGCCICKVDFLHQLRKESDNITSYAVGDGQSDECLFQHVDFSFSLNPKYKATYQVEDLGDVLKILRKCLE